MVLPATTARGTPAGRKLKDGFPTTISFALNTTISLWEVEVTPPGADGGAPVEQTTMLNTLVHTKAPRTLIDFTDLSFKAAYNPKVLDHILALINVEGSITVKFKDSSTWDFFGYLQKAIPDQLVEGTQPRITCTVILTNVDANGAEVTPNYKDSTGTN